MMLNKAVKPIKGAIRVMIYPKKPDGYFHRTASVVTLGLINKYPYKMLFQLKMLIYTSPKDGDIANSLANRKKKNVRYYTE